MLTLSRVIDVGGLWFEVHDWDRAAITVKHRCGRSIDLDDSVVGVLVKTRVQRDFSFSGHQRFLFFLFCSQKQGEMVTFAIFLEK